MQNIKLLFSFENCYLKHKTVYKSAHLNFIFHSQKYVVL